jgi:hypothetical protein
MEPMTDLRRRHLIVGWLWVTAFTIFGLVLEALHAFKVPWYLSPSVEARRLVWTLGHAHGTLLGLLNLALAGTWHLLGETRWVRLASVCLLAGTALVPLGFFFGGFFVYGGDPGLAALLVPAGAALLVLSLLLTAHRALRGDGGSGPP